MRSVGVLRFEIATEQIGVDGLILRHDFLPVRSVFKGLSMHRRSGGACLLTEHHKSLKLLTQIYDKTQHKTNINKEIKKRIGRETPKIQRAHHITTDNTSDSIQKRIIISSFFLRLICCKFLLHHQPSLGNYILEPPKTTTIDIYAEQLILWLRQSPNFCVHLLLTDYCSSVNLHRFVKFTSVQIPASSPFGRRNMSPTSIMAE